MEQAFGGSDQSIKVSFQPIPKKAQPVIKSIKIIK